MSEINPIAYPIEDVPKVAGVSRTRVFAAIRDKQLKARKAGRATIIEASALSEWIASLPAIGKAAA